MLPSIDAGVSGLVSTRYRAGALSVRGSASSVGRAADPFLFPTLAAGSGYRVLLLISGVGALLFGVTLLVLTRR